MTRPRWILAGLVVLTILFFGVRSCLHQQAHDSAMQQAYQHHETAITHAAQGATHDATVEAAKPTLQADAAETTRLRAEVARLRKALAVAHPAPVSGADAAQLVQTPVDLAPLVAKQDELITAQDKEIGSLKVQVVNLTSARDSWRSAATEFEREAVALRIAHQAQVAAIQGARWRGRFEGFAAGVLSGYVVGLRK